MEKHVSGSFTQTKPEVYKYYRKCAYNLKYTLSQVTHICFQKRKGLKGMMKRQKRGESKYIV